MTVRDRPPEPPPMRLLTFTTLFPNPVAANHGIFVETRLRQLLAGGGIEARVVAPVPWFPFRHPGFGRYGGYAAVPGEEIRAGVPVVHPRYFLLPKIGMNSAPRFLAHAGLAAARRLLAAGYDFDLIDAHYYYPDGVAAARIGQALGKPVVITARGSDINLLARFPGPRRRILAAARAAAATITVSAALKTALVELGAAAEKITVLRNGVDLELFRPQDRTAARTALEIAERHTLISVGNLIPSKGHELAIAALPDLADSQLLIAGDGPYRSALTALAQRLGVAARVRFLGILPQERLRTLYAAADALILASEREGWPNVLLEAMACGTPAIAAAVGGVPEIVAAPAAGRLLAERSAAAIAAAATALRQTPPERTATRRYAEGFAWEATSRGQRALFAAILGHRPPPGHGDPAPCAT